MTAQANRQPSLDARRAFLKFTGAALALAAVASTVTTAQPPTATPRSVAIQVPAGFEIIPVALPPLVGFPMLGGFDERGRLFVAENAGLTLSRDALEAQTPSRIRILEDTDGDGVYDRSEIFADKLTFPQGVQWHRGALYVASPPSVWRLEDIDGDGRADSRKELVTGFKFDGNAADVHGPFLHPNGRLYWTHGRKGHEVYQQDGTLVSKALGARIWSFRSDGSDIQVHAGGGMDNPVELAFNQEGDIFGTVNLFHGSPRADALVHWIHGGVYPRTDAGNVLAEFTHTGGLLAPLALLGHVAPSGITLMKSSALGAEVGENLFWAEFNTRRIMRVALQREGATFRGRPEVFASTDEPGVHFTDVIEDADGSLLIIDTGEWYRRCPTSSFTRAEMVGGIYRVRRSAAKLPADPRGLALPWSQLPPDKMVDYLGDALPGVRERALSELVRKAGDAIPALAAALGDKRYLVRSNAVWALTRIGSPEARIAARRALGDADFRIRQAACQSAFVTADRDAFERLAPLLHDEAPAVRREAARALGRLRHPDAVARLGDAAAAENDAVLTHALVHALIEIRAPTETRKLLDDRRPRVCRVGLIALDQMPDGNLAAESVFRALRSPDDGLRSASLSIAIERPEWGRDAADYLAFAFSGAHDARFPETGARILSAFLPASEVRAWLQVQLAPGSRFLAVHLRTAIDAIASAPAAWDEAWREPLIAAVRSHDLSLAQAGVRAMGTHRQRDFTSALQEVSRDPARPTAFRVAALQTTAGGNTVLDGDSFQMLLEPFVTGGSPDARLQAAAVLADAKLSREQILRLAGRLPVAGLMELPQLLAAFKRGPADAEIGTVLLAQLKASPARWSLAGHTLQALFRRYPAPAFENAVPFISEIMNQAVAKVSRVTELETLAAGGDPVRGRAAFFAGAGACLSCHRVGETGGVMGPDLSHIGRIRTDRDLLEAISFPSATIARGYEAFQITTRDGNSLLGTLPRETADSVFVLTVDGREHAVPRSAIEKLEPVTLSLMPPGLDRAVEPKVLADLVAFLRSLQ